jgi:hypothetical protein
MRSPSHERVVVPNLIGLEVSEAQRVCDAAHLVVTGPDADGPPVESLTAVDLWIVTSQRPGPGAIAHREDPVTIEFRKSGGGDDAGDREPRDPPPNLDVTWISKVEPFAPQGDPHNAVPALE